MELNHSYKEVLNWLQEIRINQEHLQLPVHLSGGCLSPSSFGTGISERWDDIALQSSEEQMNANIKGDRCYQPGMYAVRREHF